MSRLHLDLSDSHDVLIQRLMHVCDLQTKKEVIENALVLLGWAASEAAKGLQIASINEDRKVYREVQTPALQKAALKAEAAFKEARQPHPAHDE
jgi:hypothetical protein